MVSRRLLALACLLLAAACGPSDADARFEKGQKPAVATLEGGTQLAAWPARIHADAQGRTVVRAASPVLELTLTASSAGEARFVVENVFSGSQVDPSPASQQVLGPTSMELSFQLDPGTTRVRVTPPATGGALHLAVISDIHDNLTTFARFVDLVHQSHPEMVLFTGDLTLAGQTDQFDLMFDRLPALEVPFYATLGNHELMGPAAARFEERIGPASVSFNVRGVQLLLVDSASALVAAELYGWLSQQLSQRPDGPALVLTHIPPLDPDGTRDHAFCVRDDADHFLQVLAEGNTTHLFVGHIHTYAKYTLRGIPVTLEGGGGGAVEALDGVGHHYVDVVVDPLAAEPVTVKRVDLD